MENTKGLTIQVGADHAGFALKSFLIMNLRTTDQGSINWIDHGTNHNESSDYPFFAQSVAKAMLVDGGGHTIGLLVCGSGIGMSIAANRFKHMRAALCFNEELALSARAHNNANTLCLAARYVDPPVALRMLQIFLSTPFEGQRHAKRLSLIDPN